MTDDHSTTERSASVTLDAVIVKKITYKDMPTATRSELMGALDPTASMQQGDILDQLARIDGREREERTLELNKQIRTFTIITALLGSGALVVSILSMLLSLNILR